MSNPSTIGVVDDDPGLRKALGRLLRQEGLEVRDYSSAAEFLQDDGRHDFDCLLLDVAMPGTSGIELQQELLRRGWSIPIIFLTGEGDIPTSVTAIKAGAVDFLTKPVDDKRLFAAIEEALKLRRRQRADQRRLAEERERLERLTPREREVLRHVLTGQLNKQIAAELGISEQTVKVHRMRITEKMQLPSVAELTRMAIRQNLLRSDQ